MEFEKESNFSQNTPNFDGKMNAFNVLIVCWVIFPVEGGSRRILDMVKSLSLRGIPVTVVAPLFNDKKITAEMPAHIEYVRLKISNQKVQKNPIIKIIALSFFLLKCFPILIRLTANKKKIILQYHGTYCAPPVIMLKLFRNVLVVGDDIRLYGILRSGYVNRLLTWAYETSILKLTSVAITSFVKDYEIMRTTLSLQNLRFLKNCVKCIPTKENSVREPFAVFIGSLIEQENRQAVSELLNLAEILCMKNVNITILIIGGPEHYISKYLTYPIVRSGKIKFTGYVSDEQLIDYYQRSAFGLLPYFGAKSHTSQRIKVLEFLSSGMAVLASPEAVDGFEDLVNSKHYFSVKCIEDIAEFLGKHDPNNPIVRAVGTQGKNYVNSEFSFSQFCNNYINLIDSIASL